MTARCAGTASRRFISTCVEQTNPTPSHPTVPTVHLHVRGADAFVATFFHQLFGSSPRAWSRRRRGSFPRWGVRFISTCVEQTRVNCVTFSTCTVHLHVRGADSRCPETRCSVRGSSPRAWSRRRVLRFDIYERRFISTCVEQTSPPFLRCAAQTVHLHVRGADTRGYLA